MEPVYLKSLANNKPQLENIQADANSPLSFSQWKEHFPLVRNKDAFSLYNTYLLEWFGKNKEKTTTKEFALRQKYFLLLNQLQLFFTEEEKNTWYSQVNLADEKELLLAIPYFAKKLKNIALYYLNLRKKLKSAKIKYSSKGSTSSLEQQIYTYLLEVFSNNDDETSLVVQQAIPTLLELQENLVVEIEELYDDKQYFDLSPTKPLSGYFDLLNEATSAFLATKGITLSSSEWLFQSFNVPVTSSFDSLFEELTGGFFELTDSELYGNFVQKYIAENKYRIEVTAQLSSVQIINIDIAEGNNYFYYPYGKVDNSITFKNQLPVVALSSIVLDDAVAGSTLEDSDTIFVKNGEEIKGAWLSFKEYDTYRAKVKAIVKKDAATSFVFPFPGYGLSGLYVPWTGFSFQTNPEYDFLPKEYKSAISQAYWSSALPDATCDPIVLNNTNLIEKGATPSKHPLHADHFYTRLEAVPDSNTAFGELSAAWLYRFARTSIPVSPNENNVILWPYCTLDTAEEFPPYLEALNFKNVCNQVYVQQLDRTNCIAASSIDLADKIYKLENYTDNVEDAMECVWLSGATVQLSGYQFVKQDTFTAIFNSGETVRFVWTGPETTLDEAFGSIAHRKDCPFVTDPLIGNLEWEKCSCTQVYHSPFGHTGKTFQLGNNYADCIIEDVANELEDFDFASWRDPVVKRVGPGQFATTLTPAFSSLRFAWYRTKKKNTWGDGGKWVSNGRLSGTVMTLKPGKAYYYRRAKNKKTDDLFPPYVVSRDFGTQNTKWITAKLQNGEWINSGYPSTMELYAGDVLKYERQPQITSWLLSAYQAENFSQNKNTIWGDFDYFVVCSDQPSTELRWPIQNAPFESDDSQYPPIGFSQIQRVIGWTIKNNQTGESQTIFGENTVTFVPPVTGTYSVTVSAELVSELIPSLSTISITPPNINTLKFERYTGDTEFTYGEKLTGDEFYTVTNAITSLENLYTIIDVLSSVYGTVVTAVNRDADKQNIEISLEGSTYTFSYAPTAYSGNAFYYGNNKFITFTNIPEITAVPRYRVEYEELEFNTPAGGFLIEQPLMGWNYNTRRFDGRSIGAKPYWATLMSDKDSTTRYKGFYVWGYPDDYIDGYLPNSNPPISPIIIDYGTVVEYDRKGYSFAWDQSINYKQKVNQKQWRKINSTEMRVSNLSALYKIKLNPDPVAIATKAPSDILLSNTLNGAPVEIYYYALDSFTWPVSVAMIEEALVPPTVSTEFEAAAPWANMSNRFYPTIANVPVLEEIYSLKDVGGYFLPQNLGASRFINKGYTTEFKSADFPGTFVVESTANHIGGRGRTQQDQPTEYTWKDQNLWLKESATSGDLAGLVKKSLTKTLQTFIPYQSNVEQAALGLVTPRSRISPWGGIDDEEWTDRANEPKSFTGIRSVSAWAESQILKQNEKSVDCWVSDVYGNQYGLYKQLRDVAVAEYVNTPGELWTRKNNQVVEPAKNSLSSVFLPFKSVNGTAYHELTGNGIKIIDCYYDHLFVETSSMAVFFKLDFDYNNSIISSSFDNTRYKTLSSNFKFEHNWVFSTEKTIYSLYTEISGTSFTPTINLLDLTETKLTKVFPSAEDKQNLTKSLSSIKVSSLSRGNINYNQTLNTFLVTYTGIDTNNKMFIVDFLLKKLDDLNLTKIDIYKDYYDESKINEPAIPNLEFLAPISISATDLSQEGITVTFVNDIAPTKIELLNYINEIEIIENETFKGNLSAGLYHINYTTTNIAGDSTYCLTLSVL